MTEKQKQWLGWGLIALVIMAVSIWLGVTYPVPMSPAGSQEISAEGVRYVEYNNLRTNGLLNVQGAADFDSTVNIDGGLTLAGDLAGDVAGNVISVGANSMLTLTVSGKLTVPNTGIIINGLTFTYTAPITVDGVISNVQLLYYQVP